MVVYSYDNSEHAERMSEINDIIARLNELEVQKQGALLTLIDVEEQKAGLYGELKALNYEI